MARRYYISRVVGDGTDGDPYRAKIADYGVAHVAIIASGPDGHPSRPWALCLVNTTNHAPLVADSDLRAIPVSALDNTLGSLTPQQRQFLRDMVEELGLDTSEVTAQTTLRQLLRYIGRTLEGAFDENNFDVSDGD